VPLSPFWPVPRDEQQRMALVGHLALDALRTGQPAETWADLRAAALLCRHLMRGDGFTEDARQAVEDAATALESARVGTTLPAAAVGPAIELLAVYECLLAGTTHGALERAKAAAAREWAAAD
jgi:hypothetical protein